MQIYRASQRQRLQQIRPHLSGDRPGRCALPVKTQRHTCSLQTRNADGQMVPFGAIMKVSETTGPDSAMRYNGFRSADLNGGPGARLFHRPGSGRDHQAAG